MSIGYEPTPGGMLQDFVRTHDLNIVLVQEVTAPEVWTSLDMYHTSTMGPKWGGGRPSSRKNFPLTDIDLLPTGRATAAVFSGIRLINVYAPSGTTRRMERESFYNS
jgi:exonuclease III